TPLSPNLLVLLGSSLAALVMSRGARAAILLWYLMKRAHPILPQVVCQIFALRQKPAGGFVL
ncbi:MAG: hypothetical protein ABIV47_28190, partial [Roseiflexaceae bacterium]